MHEFCVCKAGSRRCQPSVVHSTQRLVIALIEYQNRFLALIHDFIIFEDDGGALAKKMAGYHQFHAVRVAVEETLRAAELQRADEGLGAAPGVSESGRRSAFYGKYRTQGV